MKQKSKPIPYHTVQVGVSWKDRPFSWSQLASWEWDQEQWYKKYVLGEKEATNKEMAFGKLLAQSLEDGACKIPELVERLPYTKEHPFKVKYGDIILVGFADDFDTKTFKNLNEVKSGKKAWDQKRADEHGQLSFYALMNYITNKVKPEDMVIKLHWVPTIETGSFEIQFKQPIEVHTFTVKLTMKDILNMGARINRTIKEMESYVSSHL